MIYKLYSLSSKDSQLPYDVEGITNDKSKSINWIFCGEVDDLDVAREMMLYDKLYVKKNDKNYILKHSPSCDYKFDFGKIEYDDKVEYYDFYVEKHGKGICLYRRK